MSNSLTVNNDCIEELTTKENQHRDYLSFKLLRMENQIVEISDFVKQLKSAPKDRESTSKNSSSSRSTASTTTGTTLTGQGDKDTLYVHMRLRLELARLQSLMEAWRASKASADHKIAAARSQLNPAALSAADHALVARA